MKVSVGDIIDSCESKLRSSIVGGKIQGVGVNDVNFPVCTILKGKRYKHPAYTAWRDMIRRCYDPKYHTRSPSYIGCKTSGEWFYFSNFLSWWKVNYIEGYQLDKDLLGDGFTYSAENCIYLPRWLNMFLCIKSTVTPIGRLLGVTLDGKVFKVDVNYRGRGKGKGSLGRYTTQEEAHEVWLAHKLSNAYEKKDLMDEIDLRIYPLVVATVKVKSKDALRKYHEDLQLYGKIAY